MAIVTFMSDYGWQDHYVAAVKAAVLQEGTDINIVDISHDINCFDISHGAYVLSNSFRSFPKGTVHLVCIDPVPREGLRSIAIELEGHYFVGDDSGLFSLISTAQPSTAIEITGDNETTFVGKDLFAPIAARLAKGEAIQSLGNPIQSIETRIARQLKASKREIVGHIIRVDRYGNLITNIAQKDFEAILQLNGQQDYEIHVGREVFRGVHKAYHEVDSGNCFIIFNSLGLLQIGINKGNASELFGLKLDTPIVIEFK